MLVCAYSQCSYSSEGLVWFLDSQQDLIVCTVLMEGLHGCASAQFRFLTMQELTLPQVDQSYNQQKTACPIGQLIQCKPLRAGKQILL